MNHAAIRAQFPLLTLSQGDYPLCYLDTAATAQKPESVIAAMDHYYRQQNANVHRGSYQLSASATRAVEAVRDQLASFINAHIRQELIFTHGTTESLNMLAYGLAPQLSAGDLMLIDSAAHHANLVPWQQLALRTGAIVEPIALDGQQRLDIKAFKTQLARNPKLVTLSHVSNVLGTVNDIAQLCQLAKQAGAMTVVDGAQAIAHLSVDVQAIGCDFYAFSGHKMYGPTGVGVLWGKLAELEKLTPLLTGGEMIKTVSFSGTTFGALPHRLEAGTPPIAEIIGLGEAIEFLQQHANSDSNAHEQRMLQLLQQGLAQLPEIELYGAHSDNCGAVAFNVRGEHHQDIGALLDQQGVAIRCGHHCAMPLMELLQLSGCCRASIGIYTNEQDIQQFLAALKQTLELLNEDF
ncbi:cysteine desulfurase [Shewanella avicenniae]|uniref:Cysteine desulfurase n=1 Tax=Shewanella avicenniae TaxID=2814294 RepID=A0ABX7QS68_9GAMM|nr:cysteine desulfurase [Shewanella avicenniae]QSX34293.1 cysteine desulfurase [Shewanella avicenniae]